MGAAFGGWFGVSFYVLINYESVISTLEAIFVRALCCHFAQTETRAHRGLTHTQLLPQWPSWQCHLTAWCAAVEPP